jgi:hypothetical protein
MTIKSTNLNPNYRKQMWFWKGDDNDYRLFDCDPDDSHGPYVNAGSSWDFNSMEELIECALKDNLKVNF